MTHVSLFTGIGGLDLAAEAAGIETVLQVEREPFALQILEHHWPNVPRMTDVREVHSDGRWNQPTVVSGGFPCQPFSAAGKRRGADDDRYLWPELLRIVEELQPSWVVGENVSGLLSIRDGMEIDDMLASLEARNYTPWILHYPAAGVGAPHKRDRVFIIAHAPRITRNGLQAQISSGIIRQSLWGGQHRRRNNATPFRRGEYFRGGICQPEIHRVDDGIPGKLDRITHASRLRALGNAVVPAQAYPIFAAIAQTEKLQEES